MQKAKKASLFFGILMLISVKCAYSFAGPEFIGNKLQSNDLVKITSAEINNEGDILFPNYKLNFRIKFLHDVELNKKNFKYYAIRIIEYNSEYKIVNNNKIASPLIPSEDNVHEVKRIEL